MRSTLPLALLAACSSQPTQGTPQVSPTPSPSPIAPPAASYYEHVLPLLERSCLSCHGEGGVGQPSFASPETTRAIASLIVHAVKTGRMPPFYASPDCNSYEHDTRLSPSEIATLERWAMDGAPLGDPAKAVHATPPAPVTLRRDLALDLGPEGFDAALMAASDNYRCFALDPGLTQDTHVTAFDVTPGNLAIVHHVLAYVVEPAQIGALEQLDMADPGLGYECLAGGVGIRGAVQNQVGSFVPGASAQRMPPGYGLKIAAGSRIVMQIHYNLLAAASAGTMDNTELVLELDASPSLKEARILPMVRRNLDIAAGDPESVQVQELPLVGPFADATIYSLTGHMHMLGKSVKLEHVAADGSTKCLLHVPSWDFSWQRDYRLRAPVSLRGGKLRITCVYDNSAANQPIVDGAIQAPRDVAWGESSLDEMCMTYMMFTTD